MSSNTDSNRWWENYLVRYLTPSIAGVIIVNWIIGGNDDLRAFLYLPRPSNTESITTQQLTLLFLYGNLFCYIASYPILVFHATRTLSFKIQDSCVSWEKNIFDGYIMTILLGVLMLVASRHGEPYSFYMAFVLVSLFSFVQMFSLWKSTQNGSMYALMDELGKKRSGCDGVGNCHIASMDCKRTKYIHEITSSYRHLREHGNTAFILLLEIILAGLIGCIISSKFFVSPSQQLSAVGVLVSIWILPSVFVHLVGQYLEQKFSSSP